MPSKKIVTCFPLSENHVDQIRSCVAGQFELIVASQEEIADKIFDADIFCGHAKVLMDWEGVVEQGRLKWIQSSAAGLDHCLVPAVIDSDIIVSGCSGLFANQVAEQTMALLTGLIRRMPVFFRAQQKREYIRRPTDDLFGKTVAMIGFGGNGQRIAQILRPMVGRIVATDVFHQDCDAALKLNIVDEVFPADQLETILPTADILIFTLPLTEQNENRIAEAQFDLIQPGTYLINVGRGSTICTRSLISSLASGHLAGAGIDVVEPEPLPENSPLWGMDNVIITPHVGAQSALRISTTTDLFCENIPRFLAGESLINLVDKNLGFPRPNYRYDVLG